ncbi:unnamed protein product [Rodentolepis nana]|uniref:Uncharacterized protein n=1 Tax=Rodentolepis nana TaxID=102285 RepID=A0A0R3TSY2_RODNA|nr:unnamed protein product [Rodentolepis nana]
MQISDSTRNYSQTDNRMTQNVRSAAGVEALSDNQDHNRSLVEVEAENGAQIATSKQVKEGTSNSNNVVNEQSAPNKQTRKSKKKEKNKFNKTIDLPLGKPKGKYIFSSSSECPNSQNIRNPSYSGPRQASVEVRMGEQQIIRNPPSFSTRSPTGHPRSRHYRRNLERPNYQGTSNQVPQCVAVPNVDLPAAGNSIVSNRVVHTATHPTRNQKSSSSHSRATFRFFNNPDMKPITADELVKRMNEYHGTMQATEAFRKEEIVKRAINSANLRHLYSRLEIINRDSRDRLIVIGEEVYLFVKRTLVKYLNRRDFIDRYL